MFYINNIFKLLNTNLISDKIQDSYEFDFEDCNKPPEETKILLDEIDSIIKLFDMYVFKYDKLKIINKMKREVILLTDTDSVFFLLDRFYENFNNKTNFENSLNSQLEDGFSIRKGRIALLNIPIYLLSKYLGRFLYVLSDHFNIEIEDKHFLHMKSEILFDTLLLTKNKKSYAGSIISNEGIILKKVKMDIKGIQIRKVFVPRKTKKRLEELLERILNFKNSKTISSIISELNNLELEIKNSLVSMKSEFGLIKPFNNDYAEAVNIEVYRGVLLWNILNPTNTIQSFDQVKQINLIEQFELDIEENDLYKQILNENPKMKGKINIICVPLDEEKIPKIFENYIDYDKMINSNINSFSVVLEALGLVVVENSKENLITNFIKL
jgi:DNA polymerase elongation subunit (family B)